jgi:uncharacterized membrane protein
VLGTGWVLWAIVLLVISGLAFVPITRAQLGLRETAATGLSTAEEKDRYEKLSRQWNLWGSIGLAAPLIALVLMVTKPVLPALHP